jgi:hypothetical protein
MPNITVELWRKIRDTNEFRVPDRSFGQRGCKLHNAQSITSDRSFPMIVLVLFHCDRIVLTNKCDRTMMLISSRDSVYQGSVVASF